MAEEPGQENRNAPSNEDTPFRDRRIVLAIAVAIFVFLILLLWVQPSSPKEKKDFVQAVGVLLAALAGFGGLYFTSQNLKQTRQNTEKQLQQARESQQETQRLTERGQITERFTRAIDQLGATYDDGTPRIEIRLGGIYALERIAGDSPERDYSTVIEVLTAYVRENTTQSPGPSNGSSDAASTSNEATAEADEGAKQPAPPEPSPPTADIQAILDVLRRTQASVPEGRRTNLDLSEANLQGAYLREANLREANLWKADLWKADLSKVDLEKAYLSRANLKEADLSNADLSNADLRGTNLWGAYRHFADKPNQPIANEELEQQASSLEDATMPNSQKYEDWLKDEEKRQQDE